MNGQNIHIIRKGKFKEYFIPSAFGGFVLGIIFFLISLFQNSLTDSLKTGLAVWIGIIFLFTTIGFFSEEWYLRKRKLKKLNSEKYRKLFDLGLKINDDLEFVGKVNTFNVRFYLYEKYLKPNKYIDEHYVDIYCIPKKIDKFRDVIDSIKNIYGIENTAWGYGILSIVFSKNAESFNLPIELTLNYLTKESIIPLSKSDWENTFEKKINNEKEIEEKARTKQIIKIGKFDLKYLKNRNTST